MISTKMATLGRLKIKVFQNIGYDVIISVHEDKNKILSLTQIISKMWSCDQSLVTLAFLWKKLS